MHTTRVDHDGYTDVTISQDGFEGQPWFSYRITCFDIDIAPDGQRQPPTAHISLLATTSADIEATHA